MNDRARRIVLAASALVVVAVILAILIALRGSARAALEDGPAAPAAVVLTPSPAQLRG